MFPMSSSLRSRIFLLAALLFLAPAAYAEEVAKEWKTGGAGRTFPTERQAQEAIEEVISKDYEVDQPFRWHVAATKMNSQSITYYYRVRPVELIKTDWVFQYVNTDYDSHEAMIEAIKSLNSSPEICPETEVTPGEWRVTSTGPDGSATRMSAKYDVLRYFSVNGRCSTYSTSPNVYQVREVKCPNRAMMSWQPDLQACDMDPRHEDLANSVMTYATSPITNQCPIGNPCEPTTGNKSQSEPDLDLSWIQFTRYFNSMTSAPAGGFGPNWTHSHNLTLAVGGSTGGDMLAVGVIETDGTHLAFNKEGNDYEASNGSGDRLVSQDSNWQLYRADEVLTFRSNGRLQQRARDDGTTLSYQHDPRGRLLSITHSSGRALLFHYKVEAGEDLISGISVAEELLASYGYNANGQVANVTYADSLARVYHYENANFPRYLTGITSEDTRRYSWYDYDPQGRVVCSRHSGDCDQADVGIDGTRLVYTATGTTVVTDALGDVATYGLSGTATEGYPRKVTDVTDTQGAVSRVYYPAAQDFRRRLDTVTDRHGTQTKYVYGTSMDPVSGRPLTVRTVTEAVGLPEQRVTEAHTDVVSNRVIVSRIGNRETRISRNERLQPVSIAVRDVGSGEVRTTTLSYCEADDVAAGGSCPQLGLLKSIDGPRSDVADTTSFTYYPSDDVGCADPSAGSCGFRKGDLHTLANGLGHTAETLAYDAFGRPLSVKDANGVITDYAYHPRGWPTSVTVRGTDAAGDRSTQISYWPTGQVQQITEPDGAAVTYVYDAAQRLTDIADNAGNTVHYTLDNAGNRLKEDTLDSGGTLRRTLARIYNTLGQLTTLKDAGNHATGFSYDANGNPQAVTDALQRVTQQSYDPLNRLARTLQDVDGVAAEIRSTYNALDQVTQVTDPKGLHTTYAYNGFGDLTAQTSPDSGSASFTTDAAGNRITRTDARGITATYHYDALNRLTGIAYPDPNLDVGYQYDTAPAVCAANEQFAKGRLGQVLHANGSTAYCHDRFGQRTRKVQTINGVASTLRYAYTKSGRLAALTYPDGSVADYVRDTQGRISQIGLTRPGQARQVVISQVSHAAFGPATGWTYGNGRQLQRPLDLDYRPQAVHDPVAGGLSLGYGYDPAGAITELKNGTGSSTLAKYAYDSLGRLTQTQDGPTGTPIETYAYDATGNRTALTTAAGTASYTYPADSHRLIGVDGEARNHDAAGNTVSIGGLEFVYNAANRMGAVKQGGAVVESYGYNHRGERVLRAPASGDTQLTLYDEAGQWIGNYSATGQPQQQAIWLDNHPVALINTPSAGIPELAYLQSDHLGTPRVVIDPARDMAIWEWNSKSEVFGNQAPNADPDGDGVAFELALRFPGQQATDASGMFYNYQRDYDPAVGRYSQSDPIGLVGGVSTYGYVEGRPLTSSDIFGLESGMFQFGIYRMKQPELPAAKDLRDSLAAGRMLARYNAEMKSRNIGGSDQFYHCLAACRATQATGNASAVLELMVMKEVKDYYAGRVGLYGGPRMYSHAEMRKDIAGDMAANSHGAGCDLEEDCGRRCANYVPASSRPYLSDYIPEWGEVGE